MYPDLSGPAASKTSFVSTDILSGYAKPDGLILGVVKAARPSWDGLKTVIHALSDADETLVLLMKSKSAAFLVGRVVLIDPIASAATWIDDMAYRFEIFAPLRVSEAYRNRAERAPCPECLNVVRLERMPAHLERVHGLTIVVVE